LLLFDDNLFTIIIIFIYFPLANGEKKSKTKAQPPAVSFTPIVKLKQQEENDVEIYGVVKSKFYYYEK
jgi:hypothetical protein